MATSLAQLGLAVSAGAARRYRRGLGCLAYPIAVAHGSMVREYKIWHIDAQSSVPLRRRRPTQRGTDPFVFVEGARDLLQITGREIFAFWVWAGWEEVLREEAIWIPHFGCRLVQAPLKESAFAGSEPIWGCTCGGSSSGGNRCAPQSPETVFCRRSAAVVLPQFQQQGWTRQSRRVSFRRPSRRGKGPERAGF